MTHHPHPRHTATVVITEPPKSHQCMPPATHECRQPAVASPQAPLAVALPIDFTAFCELRQHAYLRYSHLCLGSTTESEQVVQAVLGDLAINWPQVLRCKRPAQIAWQVLKQHLSRQLGAPWGRREIATPRPRAYGLLPEEQADVAILHYLIDLTVDRVAEVVGVERTTVSYLLLRAQRRLGAQPAEMLRRQVSGLTGSHVASTAVLRGT